MNVRSCFRSLAWILLPAALFVTAAAADEKQASHLTVRHAAGQTLLTFQEVDCPLLRDSIAADELKKLRSKLDEAGQVRYRVYRSDRPITTLDGLKPIAEVAPLSCWNADFYGADPRPDQMALRYVVDDGQKPVPPGTGIVAHHPKQPGDAYYAVTRVVNGRENTAVDGSNTIASPVHETVGQGLPVLQRVERPKSFSYVDNPTLYYYVRWESPPNCAVPGKPFDYLVAVPPNLTRPAPVGIHLHCWGGSLDGGYGWWYGAEQGHILIASNQIPYDWWTGYHERFFDGPADEKTWKSGVVRPYSQTRMFAFLDWVATRWDVDLSRTHVAGSSMGGSGSPMLAIRYPERIAWGVSWVGVHIPAETPQFKSSYEQSYGKQSWDVKFEDGASVWDHFNDAWYLRQHPESPVGLITFSNGKNDGAIGWPQAVEFFRALQDTRRPHIFVWGQSGHGQRATMPISLSDRVMPLDIRTDQSLPAFTRGSLDDQPGDGDSQQGDAQGQVNLYLAWQTDDIVDEPARWEMTVRLIPQAPEDRCTVDITPRRLQRFRLEPGQQVTWTNTPAGNADATQTGRATANQYGLITLQNVAVAKGGNRICVAR